MTFQIAGGTGRLINASGILTLTETVLPVLAVANNSVFFALRANYRNGFRSGRGGGTSRRAAIKRNVRVLLESLVRYLGACAGHDVDARTHLDNAVLLMP